MDTKYEVLLVDDEPLAIEGLKLLVDWDKYGFRIGGTCENGEEAIRRIRADAPDLVVTDIRMPVMDGLRLIEETREGGDRSTLFVITSGYDDFDYALRAMRLGVSNYLTKPLMDDETDEMLRRVRAQLEERTRRSVQALRADIGLERRALSLALFGGDEEEQTPDLCGALERLSSRAGEWVYLRLTTNAQWMPAVREALAPLQAGPDGCRLIDEGRFAVGIVLGLPDEAAALGAGEAARAFGQALLDRLPPESAGQVRLAAGRSVERPEELGASLRSAEEAAAFLFFGGSDLVLHADIAAKRLSFDASVLEQADRIAALTEGGSREEIVRLLGEAFAGFRARLTSPELVRMFAARIVLRCAYVCEELGGDSEETIRRSPFCRDVPLLPDLAETGLALEKFCLDCRLQASRLTERSGGGVQAQVAEFLRERYAETFTIRELAERFYVHPVYLGQSFTRKYGVGIAQFVHELRIEEACRLLLEEDLPSSAIAERVGYKGYPHFLKQFEKKTGLKPAEYRAQASS